VVESIDFFWEEEVDENNEKQIVNI